MGIGKYLMPYKPPSLTSETSLPHPTNNKIIDFGEKVNRGVKIFFRAGPA
jgi:hypothetical protein